MMLNKGADPNHGLMGACSSKNIDIVNMMLNKGVDPNYGLKDACISNNISLVKMLVERGATDFDKCLAYAKSAIIKLLSERKV